MSRGRAGEPRHHSVRTELLAPYRLLAVRVITLAVQDLVAYGQSTTERDSARAFLSGSRMLTHWCRLADIDPAAISDQVRAATLQRRLAQVGGRH